MMFETLAGSGGGFLRGIGLGLPFTIYEDVYIFTRDATSVRITSNRGVSGISSLIQQSRGLRTQLMSLLSMRAQPSL